MRAVSVPSQRGVMGKWVVKDGSGQDPLLVVETIDDGRISIEIPSSGRIVVTRRRPSNSD
jgi:hypothetical protein